MTNRAPKPSPEKNTAKSSGADELQWAGQASPNQPDCDPHNNTLAVSTNQGGIKLLEQQVHESELHVIVTSNKGSQGKKVQTTQSK